MAADQGYAAAQNKLGYMYHQGYGVTQDYKKAVKWYRLAADQGYTDAQFNLGIIYENGCGVTQDYKKAVKWYRLAAKQQHSDALWFLGKMYIEGRGVTQNYRMAVKWFHLAADQGHILAQLNLGIIYGNGCGVTQDYKKAVKWYRLAAEQGNRQAQRRLGYMYYGDRGITQDCAEAIKWFLLAADQGDVAVQYDLGCIYRDGLETRQDYSEALKWFRLAADQGDLEAPFCLGEMYREGQGVRRDYGEAVKWYRLAAELGDEEAREKLIELETIIQQEDRPNHKLPPSPKPTHLDAKSSDTRLNEIVDELNQLIGLERVKKEIYQLMQVVRVREMKAKKGLKIDGMTLHSVFLGSPGTGKTTVARIYGKILKALGLLSKGHLVETDRSGLVGGYVGQTEIKTDEKIKEALGGILFIDEAYSLSKGEDSQIDYGNEAISILLKRMEDHRDDFVVIVAGYDNPMEKFLRSNEGLKSRFSRNIHFDDFSTDELAAIFKLLSCEGGYEIGPDVLELIRTSVSKAYNQRDGSFGNARYVRNLFEDVVRNQNVRLAETEQNPSDKDLITILPDDIPKGPQVSSESLNELLAQLNKLIGLEQVKNEIYQLTQFVRMQDMRRLQGLSDDPLSLHCVFLGSPGTGKTTVARIYGKLLNALGLLSKGHVVETDRSGLVAGFVGQTEIKIDEKIQQALGGILFIDEAYSLSKGEGSQLDYGNEAISILLKRMEDHRDDFVVIVAGYDNPMAKFLRSNEGLKSRFSRHIHFDDYSTDELVEIFKLLCSEEGYEIGLDTLELTRTLVSKAYSHRDESFGNARYVRNLFEDVVRNQNVRLAETVKNPSHKDLITILPDDIPKGPQVSSESLNELLAQLNKLIGLDQVKNEIDQLTHFVKVQQMRHLQGLSDDPLSLHCVFFGNPGTGKTTVARIYGKLLNALGLLSKGHVVETDRSGLVAGFVGQTEIKTDEKIKEALGGILFIDEAYSLSKGDGSGWDYGNDAISILLKRMEDHRDDFVVIVAGYDKPMAELLESNEGLRSRFSTHIHFPDYSPKELLEIFKLFCKDNHYQVQAAALKLVQYILENEYQNRDDTFGNGRLVRNLFQSVLKSQAVRISKTLKSPSDTDLCAILAEDIQPLIKCPVRATKNNKTKLHSVK